MKTAWKIFWGLGFILVAILIILDATGITTPLIGAFGEVSIFSLILGLLLISLILSSIVKGRIAGIFFPLAFIFMIFEKNIATLSKFGSENIINNWLVLLIALLLTIGSAILFSSKDKHKKYRTRTKNTDKKNKEGSVENSFSKSTVYIDCSTFTPNCIENNFGTCSVRFQNIESYGGDRELWIENNYGSLTVYVPSTWKVNCESENHFGFLSFPDEKDTDDPALFICGENNYGHLIIKYE